MHQGTGVEERKEEGNVTGREENSPYEMVGNKCISNCKPSNVTELRGLNNRNTAPGL